MAQLVDVEGKPFSQARDSCCHEGCPALGRWVRAEGAGRLGYGYANRNIQAQIQAQDDLIWIEDFSVPLAP